MTCEQQLTNNSSQMGCAKKYVKFASICEHRYLLNERGFDHVIVIWLLHAQYTKYHTKYVKRSETKFVFVLKIQKRINLRWFFW